MYPQLREWKSFAALPQADEALKTGDLQNALNGFALEQMLELRSPLMSRSDGPSLGFGATLWLLGDHEGAGHVWAQATELSFKGRFTHSNQKTYQGALLLWFASVRLNCKDWHNLADRTFDKLLRKNFGKESWPAECALFLQKKEDLSFVLSKFGALRERQFPKAMFYAGVRAIEEGDKASALEYWDRINKPKIEYWELEYHLAVYERERLRGEI